MQKVPKTHQGKGGKKTLYVVNIVNQVAENMLNKKE